MNKTIVGVLLAIILVLPGSAAYAQGGTTPGKLIIGQNFTLKSDETLNGDLVVIGGELGIEFGAKVKGDIVVIGGGLRLDGETTGSAIVIGGTVAVGERAVVSHDMVTLGGAFRRAEGARIGGDIITNLPLPSIDLPRGAVFWAPPIPPRPEVRFDFGPLGEAAGVIVQALLLAALGMLLGAFVHPQLDRVAGALSGQPFIAGSVGLLTIVTAAVAALILAITLILSPFALAIVFLLVVAWLFGVVALGLAVGYRISRALNRTWEPVVAAGVGSFTLALAVGIVNSIPCVGWLAPTVVGLLALGAAMITLLGTRASPLRAVSVPISQTDVPPVEPR
jgi:hypothetical protein